MSLLDLNKRIGFVLLPLYLMAVRFFPVAIFRSDFIKLFGDIFFCLIRSKRFVSWVSIKFNIVEKTTLSLEAPSLVCYLAVYEESRPLQYIWLR